MTPGDHGEWPEGADPEPNGVTTVDEASAGVDPAHESTQGDAADVPTNASDPAPGSSEATPATGPARDA